ncbi:hypothetical protein IJI76_02495 [Candidatus Saccharibacteria bacterium]|nr:hypothetical protein [Candidatus Saccharibacteria bacterium]
MDPNNNKTPGGGDGAMGQALTPDPSNTSYLATMPGTLDPNSAAQNPAADIANAAMNGATPIVTTTVDEENLPGRIIQPQAGSDLGLNEVSTVSANPNTPGGGIGDMGGASTPDMSGMPMPGDMAGAPGEATGAPGENPAQLENKQPAEEQEPLVAAAPVPGSIGSARSYADIRREEAEKAAKVAAAHGKKFTFTKKNILIIVAIVVFLAFGGVIAWLVFGGNSSSSKPTQNPTPSYDDSSISTLSCKRTLATEEYTWIGAVGGSQENIFYFSDDVLDGLVTNFSYTYTNKSLAEIARANLAAQYGVKVESENKEAEEPKVEGQENTTDNVSTETNTVTTNETTSETSGTSGTKKTVNEMLYHNVSIDGTEVIHGMEVKSEDISDWLASDAYSDVTYGAQQAAQEGVTVTRNLEYYKGLQNNIGYTCSVSKGY